MGGGTPTLLEPKDLARLLSFLNRDYQLVEGGEFTKDMFDLIALGQGSYGYANDTQYINFEGPKEYQLAIEKGELPVAKSRFLDRDEVIRRRVIFGLKTEINLADFEYRHGIDVMKSPVGELESIGAIERDSTKIRLSRTGELFADWLQMAFYSDRFQ